MNIDSLKIKLEEAWQTQFGRLIKDGRNEAFAAEYASEIVRPFAKRSQSAFDMIFLFERALQCELPSSLKEFWNSVDLLGTVIWDVEFKLKSRSHVCGDPFLDGILETSLMNHRNLKLEKKILTLALMGEAWLGFDLSIKNEFPLYCFDSDGETICRVAEKLDEFLYACAELTIAYGLLVPGEVEWKDRVRSAITPNLVSNEWVEWMLARRPRPI